MFKYTAKYTDFDGNERVEDHYFHLSTPELIDMHLASSEGYDKYLERIMHNSNPTDVITTFKELILKSYGVKTDEGRVFEKSEELSRKFSQSAAYETMYMDLASNTELAAKFANGIIPANFEKEIAKLNANNEGNNA